MIETQSTEQAVLPRERVRGYRPGEVRRALWFVVVAWIFGAAFCGVTAGAAITSFLAVFLKADDFWYGVAMAAAPAAMIFQFIGSYVVERTGRIKRNFLIFVTFHRLLWLVIAAIPVFFSSFPVDVQIGIYIAAGFISTAAAGYGGAGWHVWMSDIVPPTLAGKFFGNRARLGWISMVITAALVGLLISRFEGQGWVYALIFGIGAILGATDILLFIPVREIPRPVEPTAPPVLEMLVTPWRDRMFRRLALYIIIAWIAYMMMGPFVWKYCFASRAVHGLGMSALVANILLLIIPWLGMAITSPYWGQAIDRFGPKPVISVSSAFAIVLPMIWVIMRPEWTWMLWGVFILSGLTWPGIDQVMIYLQVKGFPAVRRTMYNASLQIVLGLASTVGSILGGIYAGLWEHLLPLLSLPAWVTHYHPVFLTSILLRIVAYYGVLRFLPLPSLGAKAKRRVSLSVVRAFLYDVKGLSRDGRDMLRNAGRALRR